MSIDRTKIPELHAIYERMTGLEVPLTLQRNFQWEAWLVNEWTEDDLRLVVEVLRRKIKAGHKTLSCLRFSTLIGNTEWFAEDLAEAKALARRPQEDRGRSEALRATGRPSAPEPAPARKAGDVLAAGRAFAEFKKWKEENL